MKTLFEPKNSEKPSKGKALISEPFLDDPYFKRVVIVLCEHNDEGTFGFVLNNYIDNIDLTEMIIDFPEFDTKVSIGGPVSTSNIFYLHTRGDIIPNSQEITKDLFFGGDYDTILKFMKTGMLTNKEIRFFVGYSGWSPGQLENELKEKSWFVATIDKDTAMETDEDDLWKKVLSKLGKREKIISNIPENPELN